MYFSHWSMVVSELQKHMTAVSYNWLDSDQLIVWVPACSVTRPHSPSHKMLFSPTRYGVAKLEDMDSWEPGVCKICTPDFTQNLTNAYLRCYNNLSIKSSICTESRLPLVIIKMSTGLKTRKWDHMIYNKAADNEYLIVENMNEISNYDENSQSLK